MAGPLLLPERIRMNQDRLSPGQRRVARFCLSQPRSASELAAARIGDMIGVSESTVVRLALRLGYVGFPELQQAIRETVKSGIGDDASAASTRQGATTTAAMLEADSQNFAEIAARLDPADVGRAVDLLADTRTIYVVGFRTSFSVAYLASFLLQQIHPQTRLMGDSGGSLVNDVAAMEPGDTVVAIAFPRYVRKTIQVVEYAIAHGIRSIAITDSFLSPIATADIVFSVPHDTPSFFNSNIAATLVVNALVAEYADRTAGRSSRDRRHLVETFYEVVDADVNGRNGRR
ncbi:MAG TPA: MurR/RpiR family transcriptional regulator [Candidatus Saccharimonadales bacterium]|nr:MurR/RpiR family transcriptional regulator [Candidatus Saccharimonadales bacterium]